MKNVICASMAFAMVGSAHADILWDQTNNLNPDGFFSDAYSSQGAYSGVTSADDFALSNASTVTSIQFYGSPDAHGAQDNSDFSSIEVVIFDANFNVLQDFTSPIASLTPVNTGADNTFGGHQYLYTLTTAFTLDAGAYRISVGGNTVDPVTGSYFIWSAGGSTSGTNYANVWTGQGFETFTDSPDSAFRINGTPVPEPASFAAVGLGVAALARRKRK